MNGGSSGLASAVPGFQLCARLLVWSMLDLAAIATRVANSRRCLSYRSPRSACDRGADRGGQQVAGHHPGDEALVGVQLPLQLRKDMSNHRLRDRVRHDSCQDGGADHVAGVAAAYFLRRHGTGPSMSGWCWGAVQDLGSARWRCLMKSSFEIPRRGDCSRQVRRAGRGGSAAESAVSMTRVLHQSAALCLAVAAQGARRRPATSLPGCRGGFQGYRAMTATVVRPPSTSSTMPWTKADSSLAR